MDPTLRRYIGDPGMCEKLRCISDKQTLTTQYLLSCNVDILMKIANLTKLEASALLNVVSSKAAACCFRGSAIDLAFNEETPASSTVTGQGQLNTTSFFHSIQYERTEGLVLNHTSRSISTGSDTLDAALRGGYHLGMISEICGPPGVGKTQICLSACASVLLAAENQPVSIEGVCSDESNDGSTRMPHIVYFDTELKFDAKRLGQILANKYSCLYNNSGDISRASGKGVNFSAIESFLERIIVRRPTTSKELLTEIFDLEDIVTSYNVKLIVIDSMAALVRKEGSSLAEKDLVLFQQAAELRRVADLCGCAVLVTNQIVGGAGGDQQPMALQTKGAIARQPTLTLDATGEIGGAGMGTSFSLGSPRQQSTSLNSQYKPALGAGWFHCVSVRIFLDWQYQQEAAADIAGSRRLSILKCPFSADNFDLYYRIDNSGVKVASK
jgi:RecA/RadA recombinase